MFLVQPSSLKEGPAFFASFFPCLFGCSTVFSSDEILPKSHEQQGHRGSVLGFLLGAAYGMEGIPAELLEGLYKKDAIRKEVNEFLDQIF